MKYSLKKGLVKSKSFAQLQNFPSEILRYLHAHNLVILFTKIFFVEDFYKLILQSFSTMKISLYGCGVWLVLLKYQLETLKWV